MDDAEVTIMDESMELVALSSHICFIVDIVQSQTGAAEKEKKGNTRL